jgi:hypothetical protein
LQIISVSKNQEVGRVSEGEYTVNTVYTCMQMIPIETISGIRGRGIKENSGGGEFKYDVFDIL